MADYGVPDFSTAPQGDPSASIPFRPGMDANTLPPVAADGAAPDPLSSPGSAPQPPSVSTLGQDPMVKAMRDRYLSSVNSAAAQRNAQVPQVAAAQQQQIYAATQSANIPTPQLQEPDKFHAEMKDMGGKTAMMLIAAALLAGKGQRSPFYSAARSIGAATKAYREGQQQAYDTALNEYKLNMERIKTINDTRQTNFNNAISKGTLLERRAELIAHVAENNPKLAAQIANMNDFAQALKVAQEAEMAPIRAAEAAAKLHNLLNSGSPQSQMLNHFREEKFQQTGAYPTAEEEASFLASVRPPRSAPAMALQQFVEDYKSKHNGASPSAGEIASFNAKQKAQSGAYNKWFGGGTGGDLIQAQGTAVSHLVVMRDLLAALKTNDQQTFNRIANSWGMEFGATPKFAIDSVAQIVGSEMVKAIVKGGGGVAERAHQTESLFNTAGSPEQIEAAMGAAIALMRGQADNTKRQAMQNTGVDEQFFLDHYGPEAQEILFGAGGTPSAGGGEQTQVIDGVTYVKRGEDWYAQ